MAVTIQLDTSRCVAYGVCVDAAGAYFDLPDGSPVARVLHSVCDEDDLEAVADAARSCPAAAITLVDD